MSEDSKYHDAVMQIYEICRKTLSNYETPKETVKTGVSGPVWKANKFGGEWAFATNRDGSANIVVADIIKKLENNKATFEGYSYTLSKDGKFLNRKAV